MKTDTELVAGTLRGSQDAFRELVVRFERPVYSLVQRMVQNPATAEDLAQEVFLKAYRRLDSYDPQWKFSSWLFKIAHNTTIDQLRRGVPETVPLESAGEDRGGLSAGLGGGGRGRPPPAGGGRGPGGAPGRAPRHPPAGDPGA